MPPCLLQAAAQCYEMHGSVVPNGARRLIRRVSQSGSLSVLLYLRNARAKCMKNLGCDKDYRHAQGELGFFAAGELFPARACNSERLGSSRRRMKIKIGDKLAWLGGRNHALGDG